MTVDETIELLEAEFKKGNTDKSDLLYKVTIRTDPYEPITDRDLPAILIEEGQPTEFENAEQGNVVKQFHNIDLKCIVLAQNIKRKVYKAEVNKLSKNAITKMLEIINDNIQKWKPEDSAGGEFLIGSMKVSMNIVSVRVTTYWEDL